MHVITDVAQRLKMKQVRDFWESQHA